MSPGQLHLFVHRDHPWLDALAAQGYSGICERNGQICAIQRFNFTAAIVVGLDPAGDQRRYCFEHEEDAWRALAAWDGKDRPGGAWIKCKGAGNRPPRSSPVVGCRPAAAPRWARTRRPRVPLRGRRSMDIARPCRIPESPVAVAMWIVPAYRRIKGWRARVVTPELRRDPRECRASFRASVLQSNSEMTASRQVRSLHRNCKSSGSLVRRELAGKSIFREAH